MNATGTAPSENREYLALDTDAADITEAEAVFEADYAMHAITPSGALVVANSNARPDLVALINASTTTLDIEGEEFSDIYTGGIGMVDSARLRDNWPSRDLPTRSEIRPVSIGNP